MTLYEGRISGRSGELMDRLNRSLPFDIRLLPQDISTNRAWAAELARIGVLTPVEHAQIVKALDEIFKAAEQGAFDPPPADEDVHTLVERLLTEKLGPTGAKIHTGRSRNDQVVCDLRLYTVSALDELNAAVWTLIDCLRDLGEKHVDTLLAGTTHLQPALPVSLSHFLLSLAFGLVRDHQRLHQARRRADQCPLGAGAMAGSGFPVDREALAKALGFEGVLANSIDAVSDRDFCQETASSCAMLATRLSRYAEQFVMWANPAFGYLRFADEWSTGSSMMPQKRNPDAMELIRGKAARIIGSATALLALTKGLPLTYAKDLQEDKESLFDLLDTSLIAVQVFMQALASTTFFPAKMEAALSGDLLATDFADALARTGVPFRQAHARVAALVTALEKEGRDLMQASAEELQTSFPELKENPPPLDFRQALKQRSVAGGPSPASVRDQLRQLQAFLREHQTG